MTANKLDDIRVCERGNLSSVKMLMRRAMFDKKKIIFSNLDDMKNVIEKNIKENIYYNNFFYYFFFENNEKNKRE